MRPVQRTNPVPTGREPGATPGGRSISKTPFTTRQTPQPKITSILNFHDIPIPMSNLFRIKLLAGKAVSSVLEEGKTVSLGLCLFVSELSKKFYFYSGLAHLFRKFTVVNDDKKYPSGPVWVVGLYFAMFGFADQQYQNQYNILEGQVSAIRSEALSNPKYWVSQIPALQNKLTRIKPELWAPLKTWDSFVGVPRSVNTDISNQLKEIIERQIEVEADLGYVFLAKVDLKEAKLYGANFDADIYGEKTPDGKTLFRRVGQKAAKLNNAIFKDANLEGAQLLSANLEGAILFRANLKGAKLIHAKLQGANLKKANLDGANLNGANLKNANLDGANLRRVKFRHAKGLVCEQILGAKLDRQTTLPKYLKITWKSDTEFECVESPTSSK